MSERAEWEDFGAKQAAREWPSDWAKPTWRDPLPLPKTLPPVAPFQFELLPEPFRAWIEDISRRMQVPPDMPAAAAMVALAGVVGRRARIFPKREDDWVVVPNLWGAVVARPGLMKSPVILEILQPLRRLREEAFADYKELVTNYESMVEVAEIKRSAWRSRETQKSRHNASYEPTDPPQCEQQDPPRLRRYVLNDPTEPKLHEILNENPAGVMVLRDELTGWLASLEKPGRESERAFYLECWNGNTSFDVDRIGRGTVRVDAACVSIFGGIQPGRLQTYLAEAVTGGPNDDGLIQRLQVLVWPDHSKDWENIDCAPNGEAREKVDTVFQRLARLDPEAPFVARFEPKAQEFFDEWRGDLEREVRSDTLPPALESHLAKYRSLMPSLVLLCHLARKAFNEDHQDKMPLEDAKRGAAWCAFLQSHARRVYACLVAPEMRAAHELARRIKARELPSVFAARDVYRNQWTGLTTPEFVRKGADVLVDLHWLREIHDDTTGGRPSSRYETNPAVRHENH